ncbi:H-type lectin domain-containing protein [Roseovarius halotolerans]|uniref:H-type lectin domain protein n=1 Tax=Roseovarius halotolerans TaxID=505353 RepID=A0A1X6ZQD3_9RHOB|nr:H-type lectin domain-containing protein [Roseovarius halotolerans]RKT28148.1 H-type lectin domain-containing protein [Roseovarius halotolerans]SLN56445.1 H-type lectin domain protein [Roseovarius halotolerans]
MKYLTSQSIGVAQGDDVLFSDFEDGGEMWTGEGARERRKALLFREPFRGAPMVHVSLSMWDMDSATNARADVAAEKITEKGFDVVFRTWGDTRVARARIRWIAIGEVAHEDDWQLY